MYRNLLYAIIGFSFLLLPPLSSTEAKESRDASEVLQISDSRLLPNICSYELTLRTEYDSGKTKTQEFEGFVNGNEKNVMIIKAPAKIAGSVHLRKGNVIWTYYTTNHRLMKISYRAIFMDSLLNYGDIMSAELSYDYAIASMEEGEQFYKLTLTPREGHEGYGRIDLTIDKKNMMPVKREYFALSGILLKVSEFKKIELNNDSPSYIEQEFYEPLKDRKSILIIKNIKPLASVPEKYYNENYLKFLSGE